MSHAERVRLYAGTASRWGTASSTTGICRQGEPAQLMEATYWAALTTSSSVRSLTKRARPMPFMRGKRWWPSRASVESARPCSHTTDDDGQHNREDMRA